MCSSCKNIIISILIVFYILTDQIRFYASHSTMIMEHICYVTWKSFLGLTSRWGSLLFLLYICCPFLDVLSCFVTLGGAQYLFGSAACPILYSAKVKQQRRPAEELHISFIFYFFFLSLCAWKVKAGSEATSAVPRRKMDLFLEYQSSTSFPHRGI